MEDTEPRVQPLFHEPYLERGMEPQGSVGAGLSVSAPDLLARRFIKVMNKHGDSATILSSVPVSAILDSFREQLQPLVKSYEKTSKLSWFSKHFFSDHFIIELKITNAFNNLMESLSGRQQEMADLLPPNMQLMKAYDVPKEIGRISIMVFLLERAGIPVKIQNDFLAAARK